MTPTLHHLAARCRLDDADARAAYLALCRRLGRVVVWGCCGGDRWRGWDFVRRVLVRGDWQTACADCCSSWRTRRGWMCCAEQSPQQCRPDPVHVAMERALAYEMTTETARVMAMLTTIPARAWPDWQR